VALRGVRQAREEQEKRRASNRSDFAGKTLLKVEQNGEEIIRPLEEGEDFVSRYFHAIPQMTKTGKRYTKYRICRDQSGRGEQPCPGCEERAQIADTQNDQRYARRFRFFLNVIWRDGPVYKQDSEGRLAKDDKGGLVVEDHRDIVALWTGGQKAGDKLDDADDEFGGITSRDFRIQRTQDQFDPYALKALREDGKEADAKPLTEADKQLASDKYDLSEFTQIPDYDDWRGGSVAVAEQNGNDKSGFSERQSPFKRKRAE
jgi:hypothetical protein